MILSVSGSIRNKVIVRRKLNGLNPLKREALIAVFAALGFVVEGSPYLESGYKRITLYADSEGYTHATGQSHYKCSTGVLTPDRAPATVGWGK